MIPDIATTPAELKTLIDNYRINIAKDRELFLQYQTIYYPWYPEQWQAAKRVLIGRAHYWRGEMLRGKHNLARYMRGEELKSQHKHVMMMIDDTETINTDLTNLESSLQQCLAKNVRPEIAHLNENYLKLCTDNLHMMGRYIERHTYGG